MFNSINCRSDLDQSGHRHNQPCPEDPVMTRDNICPILGHTGENRRMEHTGSSGMGSRVGQRGNRRRVGHTEDNRSVEHKGNSKIGLGGNNKRETQRVGYKEDRRRDTEDMDQRDKEQYKLEQFSILATLGTGG